MDTPEQIAQRIEVSFIHRPADSWETTDFVVIDDTVTIWGENEYGDEVEFLLTISKVEFRPGPPAKEDFEPDRREPGDGPVE